MGILPPARLAAWPKRRWALSCFAVGAFRPRLGFFELELLERVLELRLVVARFGLRCAERATEGGSGSGSGP